MFHKLNTQYLISYFGLIPYIFILINKYFIFQIKEELTIEFLIYYTLIITVFIGATNWNLNIKLKNYIIIFGFLPSFFAVFIIMLNLINYNYLFIIQLLILFMIAQLFFDYFLIYAGKENKKPFYFLRLPLTVIIVIILTIFRF